jgi:hypothetical protein
VLPALPLDTWIDLLPADDYTDIEFASFFRSGAIVLAGKLPDSMLCDALMCAATAPGTFKYQTRAMYAARAALRCR